MAAGSIGHHRPLGRDRNIRRPQGMTVTALTSRAVGSRIGRRTTPTLALAALGIVYGDLGTSPLYTMQTVAQAVDGSFTPESALGILSLIFWALVVTISIKY